MVTYDGHISKAQRITRPGISISVGHQLMISASEITKDCEADTSAPAVSPEIHSLRVYRRICHNHVAYFDPRTITYTKHSICRIGIGSLNAHRSRERKPGISLSNINAT